MSEDANRLTIALAGRYRIERELGAGGMATVYLAHDLKHDRDVAIKVLHPELGAVLGADRFLAEIKTTARLQHPHILPLLDSGDADGLLYYVMPVVTGETLRARLERERQLPIPDAVRIASEIASALDYAHRHNVIHRDIKPENILLHDGQALVADFGIALAVQSAGGQRMTQTGLSLGTPQYMSPEQAMGERTIDARTDVYALGAVTYEMLSGDAPFSGSSVQAIVAKVMTERPTPLHTLRDTVSPGIEHAVFTALAKLPADRFATAAEFAAALANPVTFATGMTSPADARSSHGSRRTIVALSVALALAVAAAGVLLARGGDDGGSIKRTDVVHMSFALGDSAVVRAIPNLRLAISPSGRRIAFVGAEGGANALWVREISEPTSHLLAGTTAAFSPFFSPDGESIGFFTHETNHVVLKVIPAAGGVARTVLEDSIAPFGGASWADDGQIYFTAAGRGLSRIAAAGGAVTRVSHPDSATGATEHDFPDVLPGSRYAVASIWKGSAAASSIGLIDLRTGAVSDVTTGAFARFAPPGFLVTGMADGRLLAARMDPRAGRLTGSPQLMMSSVQTEASVGTVQFALSKTGTLVFERRTGGNDGLVWVDRSGKSVPVDTSSKGSFGPVAISPDGKRFAVTRTDLESGQVWIRELATGTFSRLSFGVSTADRPVWSPDGTRVAFLGSRNGRRTAWVRRADGSDSVRAASPGNTRLDEIAFDPAGKYTLLRTEGVGAGSRHLLIVQNGVDTVPRVLIKSPFDHYAMVLSPDGHWLAYNSDESGAPEVYVRPFPTVDSARFAISVDGGVEPVWARDGRELFYRNVRGAMFATPVTTGAHFTNGTPRLLFTAPGYAMTGNFRTYDVHPDGQRFLMVVSGGADATHLEMILNWRAELEKLKAGTK